MDMERAKTRNKGKDYLAISQSSEEELWYKKKTQIQRDSSIFACLSLRFKLNLMGLDYRKKVEKDAHKSKKRRDIAGEKNDGVKVYTEAEYIKKYAGDDAPKSDEKQGIVNGKQIINYDGEYVRSRRRNMAIQEHIRWVSFVISRGVVPATILNIREETRPDKYGNEKPTSGKNYEKRRHGNVTSYEGLEDFSKLVVDYKSPDGSKSEYQKDRYRFRYQILDDAFWLLDSNGFEIVDKPSCPGKKNSDNMMCKECAAKKQA